MMSILPMRILKPEREPHPLLIKNFESGNNFESEILDLEHNKMGICYYLCPPSRPLAAETWEELV